MRLLCLLFITVFLHSCVDTFQTSLCEKHIQADYLVGEYDVEVLGEKSGAKIEKTNSGYEFVSLDEEEDETLSFNVCKIGKHLYMETDVNNLVQLFKTDEKSYLLGGVTINEEVLNELGIKFTKEEDDDFGMESKIIENVKSDRENLINNFTISSLRLTISKK
ncbi:hypothetical protein N9N67_05540 [Bacteriovoracaceae bacterium]|nr:hypothetical protein [Bacteriovoracaceae bacterium]